MAKKKAETPAANDKPKPTQMEMLQAALSAGVDPKSNVELSNWIRKQHGVNLKPQIVANLKFQLQKRKSSAIIKTRTSRTKPADKPVKPTATGDALELVLKVNQLIEECGGADRLKQLVDVMGK